jgi:hypothetical protein
VTRRKVGPGRARLQCLPRAPSAPRDEATMEVLLLVLDEIDDFCLMVWQRASMMIE